jgi:hypothetical protein
MHWQNRSVNEAPCSGSEACVRPRSPQAAREVRRHVISPLCRFGRGEDGADLGGVAAPGSSNAGWQISYERSADDRATRGRWWTRTSRIGIRIETASKCSVSEAEAKVAGILAASQPALDHDGVIPPAKADEGSKDRDATLKGRRPEPTGGPPLAKEFPTGRTCNASRTASTQIRLKREAQIDLGLDPVAHFLAVHARSYIGRGAIDMAV